MAKVCFIVTTTVIALGLLAGGNYFLTANPSEPTATVIDSIADEPNLPALASTEYGYRIAQDHSMTVTGCSAEHEKCLRIGQKEWPFIAEDRGSDDRLLLNAIYEDLNNLVAEWDHYRRLSPLAGQKFAVRGKSVESVAFLDFSQNKGYFLPEALRSDFAFLVELRGHEFVVVTNGMINAYRNARDMLERHAPAHTRFQEFLARLEKLSLEPTLSPNEILSIYYLDHLSNARQRSLRDDLKSQNDNPLYRRNLRSTSLLNFRQLGEEEGKRFEGRLVTEVLIIDGIDSGKRRWPAIYVDDRWKLVLALGG